MRLFATFAALVLTQAVLAATPEPVAGSVPKGQYTGDKPHTSVIFRVNHLGFSTFTGRFTRVDIALKTDPAHLAGSQLDVRIDPTSVSSDNAPDGFLAMLSGEGWLEAAKFPALSFRSTRVEVLGSNQLRVHGDLTFHGVTKSIVMEARYNGGYAGHPMDPHARIGFSAHGRFKRSDFGVTAGIPAPGSMMGVGDEVEVIVETELSGPPLAAK